MMVEYQTLLRNMKWGSSDGAEATAGCHSDWAVWYRPKSQIIVILGLLFYMGEYMKNSQLMKNIDRKLVEW